MEINIEWEKLLFSGKYQLFASDKIVGSLFFKNWKRESNGELMGIKLIFRTKWFFGTKVKIYHPDNPKPIGFIQYNKGFLRNAAVIQYDDKSFDWSFKSPWSSKWTVTDGTRVRVSSKNNSLKGNLTITDPEVPLVLSALLISRYYKDSNTSIFTILFAGSTVAKFLFDMLS
jgi:hypothetical protein